MGKLVVTEFVSLDGVFEDPGGAEGFEHGGWSFEFDRGEDGDKFKLDELLASDAQLLGRVTYQGFAKAWPSITDEAGFAEKMNSMPKYVVSTTLSDPEWSKLERHRRRRGRGGRAAQGALQRRHPRCRERAARPHAARGGARR